MGQVILARFRKQPRENLEYTIDYNLWLKQGETVTLVAVEVAPVTVPTLDVSAPTIGTDGTIKFFVSEGLSGSEYQVTVLATTSLTQIVEREIFWTVEEV